MRYQFGPYCLDVACFDLRRGDEPIRLQPKAFELLAYLLARRDRVVTKDELFAACWPGRVVSDAALNTAVKAVRRAIGDDGSQQRWIHTLHKHGYRFVGDVAETLAEVAPPAPGAEPFPSEHKHLSVLCCALSDATLRARAHGPDAMDGLMRAFFARADALIARWGGSLLQRQDAGCTALFGAPQAHEDHARRAVLAGLALARGDDDAAPTAVGVHCGPVVVGSLPAEPGRLYVARSDTVQQARALLGHAAPGELLVSDAVASMLHAELRLDAVAPVGGAPAWRVREVGTLRAGVPQPERPFATPFVGRERECALLQERLADAREGRGQLVALVGEPGIGKSRLLREFRRMLDGVPVVEAHCLPYTADTPYRPALELLQRLCGMVPADAPAEAARKLAAQLERAGIGGPEAGAVLEDWLGLPVAPGALAHLSPQAQRERGLDLLCELVLQACAPGPCVVVLEDLHWIDGATDEWLGRLTLRAAGAPLLLLVSYRPGHTPAWLDLPWASRLVLPPLTRQACLALMRGTPQAPLLSQALAGEIAARAAGNPFFLEELSRSLDGSGAAPAVPGSVQDVIAARIDRLAPGDKRLLQIAAVIGTPVPLGLWQELADCPPAELQAALERLQRSGFLLEVRGEAGRSGAFQHALTQEVAYASLLRETRQRLHLRTAGLLQEARFAAAGPPELLARHYAAAGALREAADCWQQASRRAYRHSANAQAVQHARAGLQALATLPEDGPRCAQELRLLMALGPALMASRGYADPQVRQSWERALALCEAAGDASSMFKVLIGLWNYHWVRGQTAQAVSVARRLLKLAEHGGEPSHLLRAHAALGETLFHRGEPALALAHLESALAAADAMAQPDLASRAATITALSYHGWTLWHLGREAEALAPAEAALARGLGHPLSLAIALCLKASLHQYAQDAPATHALASEGTALSHEQGFPFWEGTGLVLLGWAQAGSGRAEAGVATLRRGIEVFRATGAQVQLSSWQLQLAEALAAAGRRDEALSALDEAEAWAGRTGERYRAAGIRQLRAQLQRETV